MTVCSVSPALVFGPFGAYASTLKGYQDAVEEMKSPREKKRSHFFDGRRLVRALKFTN